MRLNRGEPSTHSTWSLSLRLGHASSEDPDVHSHASNGHPQVLGRVEKVDLHRTHDRPYGATYLRRGVVVLRLENLKAAYRQDRARRRRQMSAVG